MLKKICALSLISVLAFGCDNQATLPEPTPSEQAAEPTSAASQSPGSEVATPTATGFEVNEFTLDQLSNSGCGMTLWNPDRASNDRFVFFNGVQPDTMEMMIDNEMIPFSRIDSSGEEFYGQQTSQTFRNEDGSITVDVEVDLGAPGEIESVEIDKGTIRVDNEGEQLVLPVVGDAGC